MDVLCCVVSRVKAETKKWGKTKVISCSVCLSRVREWEVFIRSLRLRINDVENNILLILPLSQ